MRANETVKPTVSLRAKAVVKSSDHHASHSASETHGGCASHIGFETQKEHAFLEPRFVFGAFSFRALDPAPLEDRATLIVLRDLLFWS